MTLLGSLALAIGAFAGDIFDEIDRYRKSDLATVIDLMKEVEQYSGDDSTIMEPLEVKIGVPFITIGLDDPIVTPIHTWNTKDIKSKMTDHDLFTACKRFKISGFVSLRVPMLKYDLIIP